MLLASVSFKINDLIINNKAIIVIYQTSYEISYFMERVNNIQGAGRVDDTSFFKYPLRMVNILQKQLQRQII